MATMQVTQEIDEFWVIHPLDDVIEQKCSTAELGKIRMTRAVRISFRVLRAYLILVTLMLAYHVLDLARILHRIR